MKTLKVSFFLLPRQLLFVQGNLWHFFQKGQDDYQIDD